MMETIIQEGYTFSCTGKPSSTDKQLSRDSLLVRGDLEGIFRLTKPEVPELVNLFGHPHAFSTGILHLKHLLKLVEMNLKIFNRLENPEDILEKCDYYQIRKDILTFVSYISTYYSTIDWPSLQHGPTTELRTSFEEVLFTLHQFLSRLSKIPSPTFHYAVTSKSPEFHLLHLHLELRWAALSLILKKSHQDDDDQLVDDQLNRTIELILQDLIFMSIKVFERLEYSDLKHKNPFSCSCVRDLWLCLQAITDKLTEKLTKKFWNFVNNIVDRMMKSNCITTSWSGSRKFQCSLESKNPELFSLWLVHHLNLLYGYSEDGFYEGSSCLRVKSNFEELEEIFKNYLAKGGKEGERDQIDEELRTMIPLIKALVLDHWRSRQNSLKVINFLWECFHRRLDQPFLVQTAGPWSVSLEKKSPKDILKQIKDRVFETSDDWKESSYGMFLRLLGIVLNENYTSGDVKVWNQVKGRIYSKFPKSKIQEFSEIRLFNLISVFLTLAVTADAVNVCNVLLDLLPNVLETDADSVKKTILSWKAQLCCLLIYSEKNLNFEPIAPKLINNVNILTCRRDETSRSMMTIFVETLSGIISGNLERSENLLIGGWVDRFLLECPKNRAGTMLKIILELLTRSRHLDMENKSNSGKIMLEVLWTSVAGRIRALVYDNDLTEENCEDIGRIAGFFTLEALRCPKIAETHRQSLTSLVRHFTSTIYVKDVSISRIYLTLLLENIEAVEGIKKVFDTFDLVVMQVWIKCSILGQDAGVSEMRALKAYVLNLEEVERVFPSWRDSLEFKGSKESVILYVNALASRRSGLSEPERMIMDKKTRALFGTLDKWILNGIKEEMKDSAQAHFVYRCLGTIILTCSPALHSTVQNSLLRTLITKSMLPPEENNYLKHLGKKIFSMILLGFENLNYRVDVGLQKILVELLNVYLPLLIIEVDRKKFKITEQLMKFFQQAKNDFLIFIFEKICGNFLIINGSELHKHSYLIMELLKNLVEENNRIFVDLIIEKCLSSVFDCFLKVHDLHPHRRQTIELFTDFCRSEVYLRDVGVRENFRINLGSIVSGRVRDYPQGSFEFLKNLFKIDKRISDSVAGDVDKVIRDLEANWRPGAASLRYSLKQFYEFCKKS